MVLNQQPSNSRFNRKKESAFARLYVAFQKMTDKQKIVFLVCASVSLLVVISGCVMLYVAIINPSNYNKNNVIDNQGIDREALKNTLDQLQTDPSKVPSGEFHPEMKDYFRSNGSNADNVGSNNQ